VNTPDNWRKSSYSGGGDGNNCLEIAYGGKCIAVRDSKAPACGILCFPTEAFTTFIETLKAHSAVTDFARFRE
jgi:hypothetical protein